MAAREAGNLTLVEALGLVCLYAAAQDAKLERAAVKWLSRYVEECSPSLLRTQIAPDGVVRAPGGTEAPEQVVRELCPGLRTVGVCPPRRGQTPLSLTTKLPPNRQTPLRQSGALRYFLIAK